MAGGAGVDAMGAVGCAWATLVVNCLLLTLALALLRSQKIYRPFRLWQRVERPDWVQIGNFARLGIPGGLAYLVEVTSFTLMALFISRLGIVASASHQIAASVATVLYMVPLSIAVACSARVSFWLGAARPDYAKRVVIIGIKLSSLSAIGFSAIIFIAGPILASGFSVNPEIVSLASTLLVWVAFYHLADALQALCAFMLRCYRITLAPLAIYAVLLWGLGLYGGYQLAYEGLAGQPPTQSATSFWAASAVAMGLVAISLTGLLWRAVSISQHARNAPYQAG